ncbi:MAG: hypothetical protein J5806_07735 [Lentisphaeria bacterium]|nr:hypothetical protein [Lentisphaeria bacterium]
MKLGTLFSDHAVLQQHRTVPVWGETLPGLLVKAEIAGKQAFARASADGAFRIDLSELPPGGPYELAVGSPENGVEQVTVRDVLVGEVWFCSGQSNMQYKLGTTRPEEKLHPEQLPVSRRQEKEFIERVAESEKFRFFTVPAKVTGSREKYCGGEWKTMTAENAPEASAAAAWFGLELRENLNVPVGLICCSWGASIIESWTSPEALKMNPDTRSMIETWELLRGQAEKWDPARQVSPLLSVSRPDDGNQGFAKGWAAPEFDDSGWKSMRVPGSWIGQRIAGNGAVWGRKKIVLPDSLAGHDLTLHLGGIDKHDITYFNGVEIGRTGKDLETEFCSVPRAYRIPGELVRPGENLIAVRGFSFLMDGAFGGKAEHYHLDSGSASFPLAGTWRAQAEYDRGKISRNQPAAWNPGNSNTPGLKFDSMVRPLIPYAVRGVIWYQGESNTETPAASAQYRKKMETLIRDWRFRWGQPELPFIQVQLADYLEPVGYDEFSSWAVLRESQRKACLSLPGVYLASALGTGEITDIHPQDKKSVGSRLAARALHHVYGRKDRLPAGPEFLQVRPEKNGALRLFFRYTEGMELRGEPGKSFYLAGADRIYHPADFARIEGDSIVLASSAVKAPVSVRYAWSNNPESILYNLKYPAAAFEAEIQ